MKPDCLEKRIAGLILTAIEQQGLTINQLEMKHLTHMEACELYKEHKGKYYFDRNIRHVTSGPVIIMEVEGPESIDKCRQLVKTIREAHEVAHPQNLLHATSEASQAEEELSSVGFVPQGVTKLAEAI